MWCYIITGKLCNTFNVYWRKHLVAWPSAHVILYTLILLLLGAILLLWFYYFINRETQTLNIREVWTLWCYIIKGKLCNTFNVYWRNHLVAWPSAHVILYTLILLLLGAIFSANFSATTYQHAYRNGSENFVFGLVHCCLMFKLVLLPSANHKQAIIRWMALCSQLSIIACDLTVHRQHS